MYGMIAFILAVMVPWIDKAISQFWSVSEVQLLTIKNVLAKVGIFINIANIGLMW